MARQAMEPRYNLGWARGERNLWRVAIGYESAAQFSRDYTREVGTSPKHDLPAG